MNEYEPTHPAVLMIKIVVFAVIVGFVVGTFLGTRKPDTQDQDFGAYYRAGQAGIAGTSPYVIDSHGPLGAYMYAPVFAMTFFRVLAHLPYLWAVRTFMVINWIATILVVRLCLGLMRAPGRNMLFLGLIAIVPTGDYLKANIHNGQVGTLLLLACIGWLCLMLRGKSFLGGMVLSLAVALKLYPALLVPYLLLRKDWRGLAGVAAGVLILFSLPAIFVGIHDLIPLHAQWLKFCMSTQIVDQTVRTGNQSLLGVLARLPFIADGKQVLISPANLTTLLKVYPIIVVVISAVIYGFLCATSPGTPGENSSLRRSKFDVRSSTFESNQTSNVERPTSNVEVKSPAYPATRVHGNAIRDVAILLLWMTIASPRAWTFNFAVDILPAMILAAVILDRRPGFSLAIVALVCAPLALAFPTNSLNFSNHWSLWAYLLQNKHFDAAILMLIALACIPTRRIILYPPQPYEYSG